MSKIATLCAAVFAMTITTALAEDEPKKEASPAQKAHRERMSNCSKDAKEQGLKGDERKDFMRQCLSSGDSGPSANANDGKRSQKSACRKEAREQELKGKERKAFMDECMGRETAAAR